MDETKAQSSGASSDQLSPEEARTLAAQYITYLAESHLMPIAEWEASYGRKETDEAWADRMAQEFPAAGL